MRRCSHERTHYRQLLATPLLRLRAGLVPGAAAAGGLAPSNHSITTPNQRIPAMKPSLFTTLTELFALAGLFGLIFFGWLLLAPVDPTSFAR